MAKLTWHGHSCFLLETDDGQRILFDPFLDQNPASDIKADEVGELDFILVSHGHADHFADAIPLAKRTGATLVSSFEIVSFVQSQGVENAHPLSIGGGHTFDFGYAKMTPALHGGEVAGDESGKFTTMPGGWWLELNGGKRVYHAGDTACFSDMALINEIYEPKIGIVPIGDRFTMGGRLAATACKRFYHFETAVPCHYGTFPIIDQRADKFIAEMGESEAKVLVPERGKAVDL